MFEEHENSVVLNENSDEGKPCINRESKSDELIIQLYSCNNINMKFLVVLTPPSIYKIQPKFVVTPQASTRSPESPRESSTRPLCQSPRTNVSDPEGKSHPFSINFSVRARQLQKIAI